MRAWLMRCLALGLGLLAACGGGTDKTQAQVRLVNASAGYPALEMTVDDKRRFADVGYGESEDYADVDPDKADTEILAPGSASALLRFTPEVAKDHRYTVLAYGNEGSLAYTLLDENDDEPDDDKSLVRVINVAPDAGDLDVYLTGPDDSLAGAVPLQAGAAYGTLGDALLVNDGTWRLRATAAGSKTDIRLDVGGVELDGKTAMTLVLTPAQGGTLVNALLLEQDGAIARYDVPLARLRIGATLPLGASVSATVGGSPIAAGVAAPAVGLYVPVAAGSPAVALNVDGAAVPVAAPTLAAGADYTMLVYGSPAAPQVSWIADDNRLPTVSGEAKVRLVDGVGGLAGGVSLTVDFVPVAGNVAPGAASDYTSLTATTTAVIAATGSADAALLYSAIDQTLEAGAVYTVFVTGTHDAPSGILRRDR